MTAAVKEIKELLDLPQRIRVSSSNIKEVCFFHRGEDSGDLEVDFINGTHSYLYKNVPYSLYLDFMNAQSKGRFFIKNIRDLFYFHKVTKK
jgi:hypothetical protein